MMLKVITGASQLTLPVCDTARAPIVERVDEALAKALQSEHTLKELTDLISPDLGAWPAESNPYLCFPLLGHLERLQLYGRVQTGRRNELLTYKLK